MTRLTSARDARLDVYRLVRDPAALARAGLFVAEGRFVVQRLLANGRYRVHSLLLTPPALAAFEADRAVAAHLGALRDRLYVVDQDAMDEAVGFNFHRGCLALAERPDPRGLADLRDTVPRRVLVLEGVNNPDNVGGLFRSAAAFGVDAVVLGPACGDPLYRKAIRTSMAATLQVPAVVAEGWPSTLELLRGAGLRVLALTPHPDAVPLESLPREFGRLALVVGTEGSGLTAAALDACDERVRIRTTAAVDSLNVTVAASIALAYFF